MQVLKITGVGEVKTASNGRKFRTVSLKAITLYGGMQITKNQSALTRVIWDEFTDGDNRKFKADQLFLDLKTGEQQIGGAIEGETVTFNTTEYQVDGKTVSKFSCVVFSNENDFKVANAQLKQNKACALDDDGNMTAPENLKNDNVTA